MSAATAEPPADLMAEACTLSACLRWRDALDWCATVLVPEVFSAAPGRLVWAAALELHRAGRAVDVATLAGALRTRGELELVGGVEGLERLAEAAPDAQHVESYAAAVLAKAKAREMISAAEQIAAEARGDVGDVDAWASGAVAKLAGVAEGGRADSTSHTGEELAERLFARWQTPQAAERALRTGIPDLDRITRGLRRGQFVVIGAGSGVGKSALALNVATTTVVAAPGPDELPMGALIFSLEMAADELMERLGCSVARVDSTKLDADFGGSFDVDEGRRLIAAIGTLRTRRLEVDDRRGLTPSQVRAKARSVAARMRRDGLELRLVVVDYVQIMGADKGRRDQNREQEVAAAGRALKNLAGELGCVVLGLAQLNQDHAKEKRKPRETDLRESRGLTNDADKVLLIWNEAAAARQAQIANGERLELDPNEADDVEIIVAKQRRGRPGTILAAYWPVFTLFGAKPGGWSGRDGA